MGDASKTAAEHVIFRSATSARAAGWGMMWKRISLRCAPHVTKPGIYINTHDRATATGDDTVENRDQTWTARELSRETLRRGSPTRRGVFVLGHWFRYSSDALNRVSGARFSCDDGIGLIQVKPMIV